MLSQLQPFLKESGFEKHGTTWIRRIDDVIQVINLQRSQWGKQFYINLGLYFWELGTIQNPKENQCHVRCRLSALVPDKARHDQTLNFEEIMADEFRARNLVEMIEKCGIPWLNSCSKKKDAKDYFSGRNASGVMLNDLAHRYLGIP